MRAPPLTTPVTHLRSNVFDELEDRFEKLRADIFGGPSALAPIGAWSTRLPSVRAPACDVLDEENQYVVTAELPGFDKKDVRLDIDENGIWIRAFRQTETKRGGKGERYIRQERAAQTFERYLSVPEEVSADGARATFRNGVLEVVIPKTAPEKRRRQSIDID